MVSFTHGLTNTACKAKAHFQRNPSAPSKKKPIGLVWLRSGSGVQILLMYRLAMNKAADRIEALEAALRQAREVLNEQALDNARQMASEHRQFMASYRPSRQQALDDDVQAVEDAIATINDLLKDSTPDAP